MVEDRLVYLTRRVDWILVALFAATSILFISLLTDLPPRATIFPWFVTGSMVIVAIVYSIGNFIKPGRWDGPPPRDDAERESDGGEVNAGTVGAAVLKGRSREILYMFAAIYGLGILIALLGHMIAVPLFVLGYVLLRGEKWWIGVGGAILFAAFIQFVFIDGMQIAFPTPYLFDWLGL